MPFQKGHKINTGENRHGRAKGTPNKITKSVKEAYKQAFDELGGVQALKKWGKKNTTEFYKLVTKLIPTEVSGQMEIDVKIRDVEDTEERVNDKPNRV